MLKTQILKFIKEYTKSAIAIAAILLVLFIIIIFAILGTFSSVVGSVSGHTKEISIDQMFKGESISMDNFDSKEYSRSMKMISPTSPIIEESGEYDNQIERKIIKNGNLSLIVKNIEISKKQIEKITEEFGGFIQSSNFSEDEYRNFNNRYKNIRETISRTGYYDIKIPSESFRKSFDKFKTVAVKINNESISSSDVTEQYSDLQTKIKNKLVEEEQYRKILKRSGKISDILEVTKYLNQARVERERMQGQLNYLSNKVKLSSIRINLTAERDVEILGITWSPIQEIKAGFRNLLEDGKDFVNLLIGFLFKLPIIIIWLVILFFVLKFTWKGLKKIKDKIWKNK